jgi:cytochrome bd-type quinol oxidase subunit 1
MDAVLLARIQFGLVAGYHFLFPSITLGLSFIIMILETLYLKKDTELYKNVFNFLIKLLAVIFVMGAVYLPDSSAFGVSSAPFIFPSWSKPALENP